MVKVSKKAKRVKFTINTKGIKELPNEEIRAIIRGADELIMSGGRALLAKILKGSKDKKVIELGLDKSPVYGALKNHTLETIKAKIDWMIKNNYFDIEYDYRLPMLVYAPKGWEIEKDIYSDELLEQLKAINEPENYDFGSFLKDRNRGLILLLLKKIEMLEDKSLIPCLQEWKKVDYKKVRKEIARVIDSIERKSE
jgi:superfamily II DNA helicase RecQ